MRDGEGISRSVRLGVRRIWALAGAEIKGRYLGSVLGLLWAVVHPLIMILLYLFVFSVVLKVKVGIEGDAVGFGIFLYSGFVPWRMIQDVLVRGPGAYLEKANLLEKLPMPPVLVPAALVVVCLFNLIVDLVVFSVVLVALDRLPPVQVVWLLPMGGLLSMAMLGLSLIVADLNVRFRDTAHVCQVLSVLWFLASPIIYPAHMVPESLAWIIDWNPLSGILGMFRYALLDFPAPSPASLWLSVGFSLLVIVVGWVWYARTSKKLADLL